MMAAGVVCLLAGLAVPTEVLTGPLDPEDLRNLGKGAVIWRVAWALLGVFLVAAGSRRERLPVPLSAPPISWGPLLGITAIGAALRLNQLDSQLWFDEMWMVVDYIRQPFEAVVRTYPSDNNHPLYSLSAWISCDLFGEHPWSLRLPAYVFGVLSILMLGILAQQRGGKTVGLVSAGVLALSFHHMSFSQNARGYTGLLFFTLLSSKLFIDALRTGRRRHWVTFGLSLALGMWLHLTLIFVALGQALWVVFEVLRLRISVKAPGVRAVVLGFMLGGLATIALHALILPQMVEYLFFRTSPFVKSVVWTDPLWLIHELALSLGQGVVLGYGALFVALAVMVWGLRAAWRMAPEIPGILVSWGMVSVITYLALGRNLWPRLFFFLAGLVVMVVVAGALDLARVVAAKLPVGQLGTRQRWARRVTIALMLGAALVTLPGAWRLPKQDFDGARAWIEEHRGADPVVSVGLAILPYRTYMETDFHPVETLEAWNDLVPEDGAAWVVSTFSIFMESRHPKLWEEIRRRGSVVKMFPGGINGGGVAIYRVE